MAIKKKGLIIIGVISFLAMITAFGVIGYNALARKKGWKIRFINKRNK